MLIKGCFGGGGVYFFADSLHCLGSIPTESWSRQRAAGAQIPPSHRKTPALSAISDSAGMPGMTRQPHFCTLSKIISLCHQKLFDLLSVQAPNQQKLDHFFLHVQHLHNRCHRRLVVSFARASQTSQRKRGFLFNRKHLKSHKLRAENSKSI